MAWVYWLAAPAVLTAVGGLLLTWRDRSYHRRATRDPMLAHQELLSALAQSYVPSGAGKSAPTSAR